MRGDLVSRPIDQVLIEAERLAKGGVRELLVISQDTSAYGVDLKYSERTWRDRSWQTRFLDLARALGELGIWVRMHYVYPYPHVDQVIPLMAEGKILPYLDIPFQHANPRVLKRMRRPASGERNIERIRAWRAICPEITLRSTFIVGFPGETDEEFDELLAFLEEAQLDRVGAFAYSPVAGAAANELDGAIPEPVKQERLERFMQTQARISAARLQRRIGAIETVLIDEVGPSVAIGRSRSDAPEIDGKVYIKLRKSDPRPAPGMLVDVAIKKADEHDLHASLAVDVGQR
jgi:ribosomal protein S12 methylthiotransferase